MPTHSDRRGSITEVEKGKVFRVRWDDQPGPDGKRRPRSRTIKGSRADARRELARILREVDLGLGATPDSITVAAYLEHWLTTRVASHCNALTQQNYRQHVERHIVPSIGSVRLGDLSAAHIAAMHARLLREGNQRTGGGLAHSTLRICHIILSTALNHAVEVEERIPKNPARKAPPPPLPKVPPREPDSEFRQRLLAAVRDTELYLPVVLGLTTGMRKGEILGLWWSDVHFARGTLTVQRQLQWFEGKPVYCPPKSDSGMRTFQLAEVALAALRRELAIQEERRRDQRDDYEDAPNVIRRPWGEPMTPGTLSGLWRRLKKKHPELAGWRFHHTRHGCATVLLEQGVSSQVGADQLGHASAALFEGTYAHVTRRLRAGAAAALDAGLEEDFKKAG